MHEENALVDFLEQLHEEVRNRASELGDAGDDTLREAFTSVLIEDLAEYGVAGDPQVCPVNERAGRGNAVADAMDVDLDSGRIDVFVSVYRQNTGSDTLTGTDIKQVCRQARHLVSHIEKGWQPSGGLNSDGELLFDRVQACVATTSELRIFILSDCIAKNTEEIIEKDGALTVRTQIWDARRVHRIRSSGREYESLDIDVTASCPGGIPCLENTIENAGYQTYLALIPGEFLHHAYDAYGPRLLELNVRSFLMLRGAVNKGIRDTLINSPDKFLAYNNGITATVEDMRVETGADGRPRITWLRGFQVVNGAQTMATIHSARKNDSVDLSGVQVQAKITHLQDEDLAQELVPNISKFANTQNKVNAADLSANDPLHIRIEQLSETVWAPKEQFRWFYERARGQYQVARSKLVSQPAKKKRFDTETPTKQKFTKTDMAKYLNAWNQVPHTVSAGAQKNFTALMKQISASKAPEIDDAWYRDLIAKAIIFKSAESIARTEKLPAYRANAVAYTVALVAYRTQGRIDLDRVWQEQAVSAPFEGLLREWLVHVHAELRKSAGSRNVTEWCKREDCWRHIQTMDLEFTSDFATELAAAQPLPTVGSKKGKAGAQLTEEDRENIARVMMVPADRWLQIHSEGVKRGLLNHIMAGITHTILGYASAGWKNVPSAKQAKQGVKIIELLAEYLTDQDS